MIDFNIPKDTARARSDQRRRMKAMEKNCGGSSNNGRRCFNVKQIITSCIGFQWERDWRLFSLSLSLGSALKRYSVKWLRLDFGVFFFLCFFCVLFLFCISLASTYLACSLDCFSLARSLVGWLERRDRARTPSIFNGPRSVCVIYGNVAFALT